MSRDEIEAFLAEPRVAVIATVDGRGRPHTAPVWFAWENGAAYLFTGRGTRKWRNLEANPHASLCVDDRSAPYRSVILEGRVEEASPADLYRYVERMALAYYGAEQGAAFAQGYRGEKPGVVLFRLVPERIVSQRSD